MRKIILSTIALSFLSTHSAFANPSNNNLRYQYTFFSITNHESYPVALTIVNTKGTWEKSVSLNVPTILKPNEQYQNTLISAQTNNSLESFVSTEVAQIGNERENYLIFSESGSSHTQSVSAHIFDGLGEIFVNGVTNHCSQNTIQGYADCELTA